MAVPGLSPKNRFCNTELSWGTPSDATDMRGSEKAEVVPTPISPLVGLAEQRGPYHHPEPPPYHVNQRLRCPVHVLNRAPPYRPAFRGRRSGS